jgi:diguanylate cyclase (GGDEF)-like protein
MFARLGDASASLDVTTLFIVATCVTSLLGVFLLFAWIQDRVRALAWWAAAYLIGGFSVAFWSIADIVSPPLPVGIANALLFLACGMIWSAARVFHGRPVLWAAMTAGAAVWLVACVIPEFAHSTAARVILSSLTIAVYAFLTAAELWRERRKALIRRWPAIFVPIAHGAIFLVPVPLASLLPADDGMVSLTAGWITVFALEIMLYVIGTAFIVMALTKDRTVRLYKTAALTDPLTGLLNRRGFMEAAAGMAARQSRLQEPVSVLAFDLDHFKSINDRYGHHVGDAVLRLFAAVARGNMRADDILGRLGGEEFVALVPGTLADAATAAERVRAAFAAAAVDFDGELIEATVSVGAACGSAEADLDLMIARADAAMYRAKVNGRNRLETADEAVPAGPRRRIRDFGADSGPAAPNPQPAAAR